MKRAKRCVPLGSVLGALAVANAELRRRYRTIMSAYPGLDGYIRLALKK